MISTLITLYFLKIVSSFRVFSTHPPPASQQIFAASPPCGATSRLDSGLARDWLEFKGALQERRRRSRNGLEKRKHGKKKFFDDFQQPIAQQPNGTGHLERLAFVLRPQIKGRPVASILLFAISFWTQVFLFDGSDSSLPTSFVLAISLRTKRNVDTATGVGELS